MSKAQSSQSGRDDTTHALVPETWLLGGVPRNYWFYICGGALLFIAFQIFRSGNGNTSSHENILAFSAIGVFAFFAVVFPSIANYFIPRRIELKPDKICIYHPYQFKYINLSDLTQIRPPRPLEALLRLKSKDAIALVGPGRKKTLIEPKQFKDTDESRDALVDCLRPRLRNLAARPPCSLVLYPEPFPFVLAGLVLGPIIAFKPILILAAVPLVVVFTIVGVMLSSRRVVFKPDGINVQSFRKPVFIPYGSVKAIELRIKNGREILTLRDNHKNDLLALSSDKFDFPHIRDFLVIQCREAHISGDPSHNDLNLCAFDIPLAQVNRKTNPDPEQTLTSAPKPQPCAQQNQAGAP